MKKKYALELLILSLSAFAGILIYEGKVLTVISGFVILFFTSYFLVKELKKQTIKEYLKRE